MIFPFLFRNIEINIPLEVFPKNLLKEPAIKLLLAYAWLMALTTCWGDISRGKNVLNPFLETPFTSTFPR